LEICDLSSVFSGQRRHHRLVLSISAVGGADCDRLAANLSPSVSFFARLPGEVRSLSIAVLSVGRLRLSPFGGGLRVNLDDRGGCWFGVCCWRKF
jgi:hypothetical protein